MKDNKTIAAGEFKAKCLKLIDEVNKTKQDLVITKRGKPVAKLTHINNLQQPPLFGCMQGTAELISGENQQKNNELLTNPLISENKATNSPPDTKLTFRPIEQFIAESPSITEPQDGLDPYGYNRNNAEETTASNFEAPVPEEISEHLFDSTDDMPAENPMLNGLPSETDLTPPGFQTELAPQSAEAEPPSIFSDSFEPITPEETAFTTSELHPDSTLDQDVNIQSDELLQQSSTEPQHAQSQEIQTTQTQPPHSQETQILSTNISSPKTSGDLKKSLSIKWDQNKAHLKPVSDDDENEEQNT